MTPLPPVPFEAYASSFLWTLYVVAVPLVVLGAVVAVTAAVSARASSHKASRILVLRIVAATLPLAVTGMAVGYMTGISRQPAITALVPALLTVVAGAGLYSFGQSRRLALLAPGAITAFTVFTLWGASLGAYYRQQGQEAAAFEQARQEVRIELLQHNMRKGLGLTDAADRE